MSDCKLTQGDYDVSGHQAARDRYKFNFPLPQKIYSLKLENMSILKLDTICKNAKVPIRYDYLAKIGISKTTGFLP